MNWKHLVLGPLLFNVFINDIFLFIKVTNICNYADDTAIFACHPTLEAIIRQLEAGGTMVAKWFSDNYLRGWEVSGKYNSLLRHFTAVSLLLSPYSSIF